MTDLEAAAIRQIKGNRVLAARAEAAGEPRWYVLATWDHHIALCDLRGWQEAGALCRARRRVVALGAGE